ncbi:MAG: twin-arginine translocation signal domain-containing protein, partial [Planctomycetota bacterium]
MESIKDKKHTVSENKVSRRNFLKVGGVGAAVLATGQTASAEETKGKRLAMIIDLQRCTG